MDLLSLLLSCDFNKTYITKTLSCTNFGNCSLIVEEEAANWQHASTYRQAVGPRCVVP